MDAIIDFFKTGYGLQLLMHIVRIISVTFITLGLVYWLGRLLTIKMKHTTKNRIAAVALPIISWFITSIFFHSNLTKMLWETFAFACIGSVTYVIIGWRFYDRMDSWFDKRGLKDKHFVNKRKRT